MRWVAATWGVPSTPLSWPPLKQVHNCPWVTWLRCVPACLRMVASPWFGQQRDAPWGAMRGERKPCHGHRLAFAGWSRPPLACATWVIIPQYNVGGASRRNCCTRANQDGPEAYGFRGNAQNLDLNRDFVKMDSRNAFTFVETFHAVNPDVFIDTHTSNGADYPHDDAHRDPADKAGPVLGPFIRDTLTPALNAAMAERGVPMVPYVYSRGETPDDGIMGFLRDASLQHRVCCPVGNPRIHHGGAHAQTFPDRVKATRHFWRAWPRGCKTMAGTCLMRGNASVNAWRRQNPCLSDGPWIL